MEHPNSEHPQTESGHDPNMTLIGNPYKQRVQTFGINISGRWVALGGKQLNFIDLDNHSKEIHIRTPQQSYDINVVEWNKTQSQSTLIATAANTEATIWGLDTSSKLCNQITKIQLHKRGIADVCWSNFESQVLATCAADGYIFLWDLRDSKKPAKNFKSYSAAPTKLRWNRVNHTTFASVHNGEVKIWDTRHEAQAQETIFAHVSQINGIDWSFKNEIDILTCGQDKQIKFWKTSRRMEPVQTMNVGAPVLSARHTPFGRGVVTMARMDSSLKVWSMGDTDVPVNTYTNENKEIVIQFDWVVRNHEDYNSYKIISLSKDQNIRLWDIDHSTQQACRGIPPPLMQRRNNEVDSIIDLGQEFSIIKKNGIPGVQIKEMNLGQRWCHVVVGPSDRTADIKISFPSHYPRGASPSFELLPDSTLSLTVQTNIRKILFDTAQHQVEHNRPCLEECLGKLVLLLKHLGNFKKLEKKMPTVLGEGEVIPSFEEDRNYIPNGIIEYEVKPTDTLMGIAISHNMQPEQVKQANQLYSNQLIPGQTLYLKDGKDDSVSVNTILEFRKTKRRMRSLTNEKKEVSRNSLEETRREVEEDGVKREKGKTSRLYDKSSEAPVEVIKELARHVSEHFNVMGILTLTSDMLIFEPDLNDTFVVRNGVLPYQLFVSAKDIFDCQIVVENQKYCYENTLEISSLKDNTMEIYDFLLDEKRLRTVYKKIIGFTSSVSNKKNNNGSQKQDAPLIHKEHTPTGFVPELDHKSALLNSEHLEKLCRYLPGRYRFNNWKLLYSTQVHGISLNTFYNKVEDKGPSILVIEDTNKALFGAYVSDSWRIEPSFYGGGESFVFRLSPKSKVYHWTEKNSNFMCSRRDFIAVGGGNMFGLWVDSDFNNGSSYDCETFGSPCLASSEDFQITVVEVWGVS